MKKPWKTPENLVIFPLKNSQDFNGFQFHSVESCYFKNLKNDLFVDMQKFSSRVSSFARKWGSKMYKQKGIL